MGWNIRKITTFAISWLGLVLRMSATGKLKRLRARYKTLGLPGSYAGANNLSKALGGQSVKEALMGEDSYTLHRPVLYRFPRRKTIVSGPMDQFQCNLVDCSVYKDHNDGIRYLFCCIDVFTKQAWVHPLRSKRGQETAQAMESILKSLPRMPLYLQTDKGTEMKAAPFKKYWRNTKFTSLPPKMRQRKLQWLRDLKKHYKPWCTVTWQLRDPGDLWMPYPC